MALHLVLGFGPALFASALFFSSMTLLVAAALIMLSKSRSADCEEQSKPGCAADSDCFHIWLSP